MARVITTLPNWRVCVRTLVEGQVARPFTLATVSDGTPASEVIAARVRARSRRAHGRRQDEVDAEIARSLALRARDERPAGELA